MASKSDVTSVASSNDIDKYGADRLSAIGWTKEDFLGPGKAKRARFKLYSSPYLFRPWPHISMNSLVNFYVPAMGALSYEALSLHLVHKGIFSR
jgi:hypothetical protein